MNIEILTSITKEAQLNMCDNSVFKGYSAQLYFRNYAFEQITDALNTVDGDAFEEAYKLLEDNYLHINPVLTFGNGGSAAIANHTVADLVKGVGHDVESYPLQTVSLSSNSPLLTCIANDYGYEEVFAKQIEFWPHYGTLCIGVSSSGSSNNIVNAFEVIQDREGDNFRSIALVGFDGGTVLADDLADVIIHVKSNNYGIVEDCHSIILHALTQMLRINNSIDVTKIRL